MNKKIWTIVFVFVVLMLPAVVGAAPTCKDVDGITVIPCPQFVQDYVDCGETANTIEGTWQWFTNKVVTIVAVNSTSGTTSDGTHTGTWTSLNPASKTYTLSWDNGSIDTLTLSNDNQDLNGYTQYGQPVSGHRLTYGNSSSSSATINSNLILHIPYLSYYVPFFGNEFFEIELAYVFNFFTPQVLFKFTNFNIANDSLCAAELLFGIGGNPYIELPNVLLPDGTTRLWVVLSYVPISNVDIYFQVVAYGYVSY